MESLRDPAVDIDNSRGVVSMQWHTLRRFWRAVSCIDGWKPKVVSFDGDHRPVPVKQAEGESTRG